VCTAPGIEPNYRLHQRIVKETLPGGGGRVLDEPLLPNLSRPEAGAPGQFAFADGGRVRGILLHEGETSGHLGDYVR
jgi:hypothetical protein